jgi:hypothetical protein
MLAVLVLEVLVLAVLEPLVLMLVKAWDRIPISIRIIISVRVIWIWLGIIRVIIARIGRSARVFCSAAAEPQRTYDHD